MNFKSEGHAPLENGKFQLLEALISYDLQRETYVKFDFQD